MWQGLSFDNATWRQSPHLAKDALWVKFPCVLLVLSFLFPFLSHLSLISSDPLPHFRRFPSLIGNPCNRRSREAGRERRQAPITEAICPYVEIYVEQIHGPFPNELQLELNGIIWASSV